MILVTGATGTIGSALVEVLTAAGEPFRTMSRRPSAGVRGDYADADSLRAAVKDVDAVFLLTPPGPSAPAQDLALLEAAAGVRRIVKLSAFGVDEGLAPWHEPGEEAVRSGDREWTILRPSMFASNVRWWQPSIRAGEPIRNFTGEGKLGVVDPRDVAAVAAVALTGGTSGVHTLTGPELLSTPEQVAILASVLGRPLSTVEAAGSEPGYAYVRSGRGAVVTDDVPRLLGRPARTFREWVVDHADTLGA
ncbi:NAD(P)H-binding protein [Cryptosporangium arvum]|uniref:Putative nucleoside-diphosphate sugar epimerase n=1 Tax=Cryptosporangium arvum DSM 44712 TaxID=927661 RepID=A0A010ZNU7_9ACTN|nr:NAD(P)H-binding protein [Cryptosporangium arvum]EXG80354.1 putative nucleoside-diphosphate sugar epimerase [Cryptosporangium arvum DSM 44712]